MNPRRSNISQNTGRIYAAMIVAGIVGDNGLRVAKDVATSIEDAVEAAENARQDALNTANEAKRKEGV